MKTWKFLGAPLMLMLLVGMPWCCAHAYDDTDQPVVVEAGTEHNHEEVGNVNVTVSSGKPAVSVKANSDTTGDKNASLKVNGNVSLYDSGYATAVDTYAHNGDTTTNISGNVHCQSNGAESFNFGISALGSDTNQATVTVNGSVSAISTEGFPQGIIASNNANIKVLKDVSASGGNDAIGIESNCGATVNIGGNVSAESTYSDAIGLTSKDEGNNKKTTNTIIGNLTATGTSASGAILTSDFDPKANLSLTVGGNVMATSTEANDNNSSALGIEVANKGGNVVTDIAGNVTAKSPIANAIGLRFGYFGEMGHYTYENNNEIRIHGNIISDGVGIYKSADRDINFNNNVLVENEINANKVGVLLEKSLFVPIRDDGESVPPQSTLNLTVWKIKPNENGNVAEYDIDRSYFPDGIVPEGTVTHGPDTEFEKKIMYIIKVEQPSAGGTIKATDANGNDLAKSFDFDVAHEGETVLLKASLEDGYKLVAAYNGLGEKQTLLQDANGNYYIVVPKGGGVYLSVELEDTTEHSQADNDDDIGSITADPEEETATEESNDTKSVSLSSAASKSGSDALKTGDVTQVAPWIMLSLVSAGGTAGLKISSKKKDK